MKTISAVAITLTLASTSAFAVPVTITDEYFGSNAHGYGDVIGEPSLFGIDHMTVDRIGDQLAVTIDTNFQEGNGLGSYPAYTYSGNGIGFGDLFLSSTGWAPYGTSPWLGDDHNTGTRWDYGVSLADRWDGTATDASLYALSATAGNPDALLSEDFVHSAIFRNGQEVAVDTTSATYIRDLATQVVTAGGEISFVMDISGTALADAESIALHWTMTCGNDVIEGEYAMPGPSTVGLFLLGLAGILTRRRLKDESSSEMSPESL